MHLRNLTFLFLLFLVDSLYATAQTVAEPRNSVATEMERMVPRYGTVSVPTLAVPRAAWKEFEKAESALRKDDYAEARRYSEAALRIAPDFSAALAVRGRVAILEKNYREGMADLDRAIELDPANQVAYVARGGGFLDLNRPDDALPDLQRFVIMQPDSWVGAYLMSAAWLAKQEPATALAWIDASIALGAPRVKVHMLRANALIGLKRFDEAARELETYVSVEHDPGQAASAKRTLNQIHNLREPSAPR